jgi:hypothetical protein
MDFDNFNHAIYCCSNNCINSVKIKTIAKKIANIIQVHEVIAMKRKQMLLAVLVAILCLVLSNCATSTKHLSQISLGMSKDEVKLQLGEPTVVRGAIRNKFDQVIEVWEYKLALPSSDSAGQIIGKSALTVFTFGMGAASFRGERRDYWLYFFENKLAQWGQAGDWRREADRIYEFNFSPSPALPR